MKRLFLLSVLTAFPAITNAETYEIRSGDHDSFARLVVSIPTGSDWILGRTNLGYGLEINQENVLFNTSQVYERIQNDRLASISADDGELSLQLGCDCHATAFLWRNDRLVIDIVDGPPPSSSEFEALLYPQESEPASEQRHLARTRPENAITLPIVISNSEQNTETTDFFQNQALEPNFERVGEVEEQLVESLARAASQGLLAASDFQSIENEQIQTSPAEQAESIDVIPTSGVSTRTTIERDSPIYGGFEGVERSLSGCLDNSQFDVSSWLSEEAEFDAQVREDRLNLTSESGSLQSDSVIHLARTYIYFGFGAEALQVLALLDSDSDETALLSEMALIVDGHKTSKMDWNSQLSCKSSSSLWAVLALQDIPSDYNVDHAVLVRTLRALPKQLRGHLGTTLAELLVEAGDGDSAENSLKQALQSGVTEPAQIGLVLAEVSVEQGNELEAVDQLSELAEESPRLTADGVSRLIELSLAEGQNVDASILSLAESLRLQGAEKSASNRLLAAEISANVANSNFTRGFELLNQAEHDFHEPEFETTRHSFFQAFAENSNQGEFLEFTFENNLDFLPPDVGNEFAERLISYGFPERALDVLRTAATRDDMRERRYIRAEAAAIVGDIELVDRVLSGLSDTRSQQIRVNSLINQGAYKEAHQTLEIAELEDNSNLAWRAQAWNRIAQSEDQLLQTAAARMNNVNLDPINSTASLTARSQLLEESSQTRDFVSALLARYPSESSPTSDE